MYGAPDEPSQTRWLRLGQVVGARPAVHRCPDRRRFSITFRIVWWRFTTWASLTFAVLACAKVRPTDARLRRLAIADTRHFGARVVPVLPRRAYLVRQLWCEHAESGGSADTPFTGKPAPGRPPGGRPSTAPLGRRPPRGPAPRRQTQPARPPLRQVVRPAAQRPARLVPPPSSPPKWPSVPLSPPKPAAGFGVTAPTETMTAAHKSEARKRGRAPCRSAIRRRRRSPGATATKKDLHEHGRKDG